MADVQPNTCWTCKSPDVTRMMKKMGVAEFYKGKWSTLGKEINHSIGCADCHDSKTMNLRISRPALAEAFQRQGKDIGQAQFQEMRSLTCAQCHVEYYFKGDGKYLTFPWDKGIKVEEIEKYYDEADFKDWVHPLSKTPMLKAQHPDFELFSQGIHAQRGLSCADCHMSYKGEGGVKYTNHHIVSPLYNINGTCQVCHRESEEKLKNSVYERQDKVREQVQRAEELLVKAHFEAKKAWEMGASESEMKPILALIRHAQWRWDFISASHGSSFHAPIEAQRIMSSSIDLAHQARLSLAKILVKKGIDSVEIPDITTKDKAQKVIGLDMPKLVKEKQEFINSELTKWQTK